MNVLTPFITPVQRPSIGSLIMHVVDEKVKKDLPVLLRRKEIKTTKFYETGYDGDVEITLPECIREFIDKQLLQKLPISVGLYSVGFLNQHGRSVSMELAKALLSKRN